MKTDRSSILNRMTLWVVLFTFTSVKSFSVRSADDSTKKPASVYDINDPRHPDCPCHKYQKLADQEYARLMKNKSPDLSGESVFNDDREREDKSYQQKGISNSEVKGLSREDVLARDKLIKKNRNYFFKIKRKRKAKSHDHLKIISGPNHFRLWRRHIDIDSCFKWK